MRPLTGVQVLEVGQGVASGYAGKLLADLGATVTRLPATAATRQMPEEVRRYHELVARYLDDGKQEAPAGASPGELAAAAQIVIATDNLAGLRARDLDPDELANAGKILIAMTSFGLREESPQELLPDLLASALGGFVLLTGLMDHTPVRSQASLPQFQAALAGVVGALAALLAAEAGGGGEVVDVSLYESTAFLMEREDIVYTHQDTLWERTARHKVVHPFAIFPCGDGYVALAVASPMQFRSMCELIDAPELAEDEQVLLSTITYADAIDVHLLPWLAEHDRAEVCALFQERRIPATPVLDFHELLEDAQLVARRFFGTMALPQQERVPGPPYRFSGEE